MPFLKKWEWILKNFEKIEKVLLYNEEFNFLNGSEFNI